MVRFALVSLLLCSAASAQDLGDVEALRDSLYAVDAEALRRSLADPGFEPVRQDLRVLRDALMTEVNQYALFRVLHHRMTCEEDRAEVEALWTEYNGWSRTKLWEFVGRASGVGMDLPAEAHPLLNSLYDVETQLSTLLEE